MRRAAIVLVLLLAAVARAEDDDAVLETPPLGEPIPERMQTLEKEWDDDVGTKDHADTAAEPEPDPFEHNAAPEDDPDVEVKTPPPPADERPEPPRRASTLEEPLARDQPTAKTEAKPSEKASTKPDGGAERRAATLRDAQ